MSHGNKPKEWVVQAIERKFGCTVHSIKPHYEIVTSATTSNGWRGKQDYNNAIPLPASGFKYVFFGSVLLTSTNGDVVDVQLQDKNDNDANGNGLDILYMNTRSVQQLFDVCVTSFLLSYANARVVLCGYLITIKQ